MVGPQPNLCNSARQLKPNIFIICSESMRCDGVGENLSPRPTKPWELDCCLLHFRYEVRKRILIAFLPWRNRFKTKPLSAIIFSSKVNTSHHFIEETANCLLRLFSINHFFSFFCRGPQGASHTCITYDAVNQAYIDARKRIRKFDA